VYMFSLWRFRQHPWPCSAGGGVPRSRLAGPPSRLAGPEASTWSKFRTLMDNYCRNSYRRHFLSCLSGPMLEGRLFSRGILEIRVQNVYPKKSSGFIKVKLINGRL